ncbi:MAG TPA: carboxypeptidase regulatory-like domain-containing protein, partial [Thermoanaerobaculia bacterium]|nr:carboxypeptidase regulatory-like domain-containing protein [Thermoanaerobaculia bacterium]
MKKLQVLFVALMIVSMTVTAEAGRHKKKHPQPTEIDVKAERGPAIPAPHIKPEKKQAGPGEGTVVPKPGPIPVGPPVELQLTRAASRSFDLRSLPQTRSEEQERKELEPPDHTPVTVEGIVFPPEASRPAVPTPSAPAPAPLNVFDGLDRFNFGAGSPPDTNGDVGPVYYMQTVNTSLGVFRKSDGARVAGFTFNTFMSQGNFGNLCDTNNFGDPVVLYDTFEDRWIVTDFAFVLAGGNVVAPAYQCIAASMSGDPVSGGWNFYSIKITDNLNDYPKFGIWPDGLYMSANMFSFGAGSSYQGFRVWAFNKAQMYAGSPTVKVVSFSPGSGDFTVIPSNARLQTGTPPAGRPNLYISSWNFLNALTVYKFHVDWNRLSLSTFTGPDVPLAATAWPNAAVGNAPQPGTATLLDVLQIRAMVQNQYTNFGGIESLWVPHTVRRANTTGFAAPRWYQVDVSGGTVAANIPQATTWDPDGVNLIHRFSPSLALDRAGNMAMGYTTSNSTTEFPSIKYAGRLATDPVNSFSQTEQTFFTGTGSQTGSTRWGDYSSMTLDPDGCTFWYTSEYANPADQTFDHRWLTKFGSFRFAPCTAVGAGGTVSGTVTATTGGAPISGATVQLGVRSTTTNGAGFYSFLNIPAGTYPTMSASFPGYITATASNIVVTDGATTTQDFSLASSPASACLTDTTQADFQTGVSTNLDLTTSPGDVTLSNAPVVDQSNTAGTTTGTSFGTPNWGGQTFIPAVTGSLVKVDVQLFCSGCTGTTPNLTLSVRATSAGLPTGADLVSGTIPGFSSGAGTYYTATFGSPATLTSGTQYALILRPVAAPSVGGYFWIRSSPGTYANGSRVLSADSGGTWAADLARDFNFKAYMQTGFAASGNLVSSPKDSNPGVGLTPIWTTIAWIATVPAPTTLRFQVAASNSINGPFNFVGPDGTAGTFFTFSGASLTQFYGFRYLEYKAYLTTTDGTQTPTLNDVSLCFADTDCTAAVTITPTPAQVCAGSTGNTASGPAGAASYSWSITNGTITGGGTTQTVSYTAGAAGNVGLVLNVVDPSGCRRSGSTSVTINPIPATPTITPGGPTTFCAGFSVTLTSSSASGNQWFLNGSPIGGATNQAYIATASGNYTVVVTVLGCSSAASAVTTVTVNPLPPTPTITPGGPTTFCTGGSVTLTSSSASGNQWYLNGNPIGGATNQTYIATASGDYTVIVTDGNGCTSASSAITTVTVNPIPATPTITPGGPTTFCTGGSVTLTSSSASGNQWLLNGSPIGGATNQAYIATASGDYTVTVSALGCTSAPSATTTVTVNPIPATPTITPGGPTTFCAGSSVTLTSSSATGNQFFLNGNPIGGATNQAYIATASGDYTVTVTTLGCTSTPSAITTVTVNPIPATPTITPGGPTSFCQGYSVTLTSSSASGNQWFLNGNPIGGATSQQYVAAASG